MCLFGDPAVPPADGQCHDANASVFWADAVRAMIIGVPTSIAALLGETARGPADARLVTSSLADFRRHFGPAVAGDKYLPDAVEGFFLNGGTGVFICRIVSASSKAAFCATLPIAASGPGDWGNRILLQLSPGGGDGRATLKFACFGATLATMPDDPFSDPAVLGSAELFEEFVDLDLFDPSLPDHWRNRIAGSSIVRAVPGDFPPQGPEVQTLRLDGGSDGDGVVPADFLGVTADGVPTGLLALTQSKYDDVSLIAAPGLSDPDVISGICAHCAQSRFRFAVLDGPSEPANFLDLDPRAQWPTSRAAYYVPWLAVPDGAGSRLIPPSGHVLGIFVRTDTSRGIWKAPANEQVHGIAGLQAYLGNAQQEVLNPRGVNVIRKFEGRGIRVWGARTLSADPDFRYIPVGRFLAWIERSLARGTQWAIFEQQGEPLWAKVRTEVTLFLRDQWRAGALPGATEEKAFYVRCDRSTMTDADIQAGRLICEIGVALIRPAEFVVFRIMHQMAG